MHRIVVCFVLLWLYRHIVVYTVRCISMSLRWRHNGCDSVSNYQPHHCLLNRLFRRRSKKTSKLRITGLCAGNSPGTGESSAQMASNAEHVSIWWRHHVLCIYIYIYIYMLLNWYWGSHCSGSLEPESSCHDRDWIMELPMEADILIFTGILTPEDASVASCFPFDITISLSWFPLLSIPPLHSAIP